MGLSLWGFAALAAATALVGFSKTAVSGANTVSLAVFAAVLPARASTGVLLPLLIVGDLVAVASYRRHAHWPTLLRLFPAVAAGVVVGTGFLVWAGDAVVPVSIGAILILMACVTMWRRRAAARREGDDQGADREPGTGAGRAKARSYGVLGGFTTMVANAGGPVMSMYLLSAGFDKWRFLGTSAWFFLVVNVSKLPFSAGLGLIDGHSLLLDLSLAAFVFPGAYVGRRCAARLDQRLFERLVIAATLLGGVELLLR
ncbi:sulfite exporter TauE/SafE family protein [Streptomyces montanisoli]|uniref:Probable membrane transporter protein n=1 Tax=Streptomyces montanisoli TaxID=2798581 RepID=A0A940RX90_9ACTN|nr:sulfite exporter TauE/SafE family protein [Streptomyces montanisoli]MBP0457898.1 sulfite exporter TauE/SafE family protein [Streptomyces montanisoli]